MASANELSTSILAAKYYAPGETKPDDVFRRVALVATIPDVIDALQHITDALQPGTEMMASVNNADYIEAFAPYQEVAHRAFSRRYKGSLPISFAMTNKEITDLWQREHIKYYDAMSSLDLMPGTPTLINAGRGIGMLSSCFFLRVPDSMAGIFETVKQVALISKSGGGVGLDISDLRPKGTPVSNTNGTSSGPISFLRVFNETGNQVTQGGIRRAALIALLSIDHPDVTQFIKAKQHEGDLSNFNMSVLVTDRFMHAVEEEPESLWTTHFNGVTYLINKGTDQPEVVDKSKKDEYDSLRYYRVQDIWNMLVSGAWANGEPGVVFWDEINRGDLFKGKYGKLGLNPCVSGDTRIAVADGRGAVAIKTLAEEGKDVPVYCTNRKGKLAVKYMRNPRVTGYETDVYKINLDDGSYIKATANHKFILLDGTTKTTEELISGDSLSILTRFKARLDEVIKGKRSKSQQYSWLSHKSTNRLEHRFIAGFSAGVDLYNKYGWNLTVHHKDRNALNNDPSNLVVMSKKDHDNLHKASMLGDKNPMRRAKTEWNEHRWDEYKANMSKSISGTNNPRYMHVSDTELYAHAISFTKQLGRRFSYNEWQSYCKDKLLPFGSVYREQACGTTTEFSKIAAMGAGIEHTNLDPRVVKTYKNAVAAHLNCHISNGEVIVKKKCEYCGKSFSVAHSRREQAYCSSKCAIYSMPAYIKEKGNKNRLKTVAANKKQVMQAQASVYNSLYATLKRHPKKTEWQQACATRNVSFEISRVSSPFRYYKDLQQHARRVNHKVVSVEYTGKETVYNGTVDEYHNLFISPVTNAEKDTEVFVNTWQCGEQILLPYESCNLAAVNLAQCCKPSKTSEFPSVDEEKITYLTNLGIRLLDNIIDVNNFPLPEITQWTLKTRRVGLGTMGLHDMMLLKGIRYGSDASLRLIDQVFGLMSREAIRTSVELGKQRGVPEAVAEFENRRNSGLLTVQPTGTISIICNQASSGIEPVFQWEYTRKDSYGTHSIEHFIAKLHRDNLPSYAVTALDVTPQEHVSVQAQVQKYIDSSISKTVNLPNSATRAVVDDVFRMAYKTKCKSVTVYRSGSRQTEVLIKKEPSTEVASKPVRETLPVVDHHAVPPLPAATLRKRPRVLFGATFKINTPGGKSYITINEDEYGIREVFVHISKAGSEITTHVEAEGRLISHSLKYGIPSDTLINHLAGHKSNPIFDSGRSIKSVPDAVAVAMQEYKDNFEGFSEFIEEQSCLDAAPTRCSTKEMSGELCPECGEVLYMASGCTECASCGYSRCGG